MLYQSKIIVFGGYTEKGYDNSFFTIDLENERFDSQKTLGPTPLARENFVFIIVNARIWLFGGYQEGGSLDDLYSIDVFSWTWVEVKPNGPPPSKRSGSSAVRVGNRIYIFGGCDYKLNTCFSDGYYFDVESMWWAQLPENSPK